MKKNHTIHSVPKNLTYTPQQGLDTGYVHNFKLCAKPQTNSSLKQPININWLDRPLPSILEFKRQIMHLSVHFSSLLGLLDFVPKSCD